jgi:hypothetical protein
MYYICNGVRDSIDTASFVKTHSALSEYEVAIKNERIQK